MDFFLSKDFLRLLIILHSSEKISTFAASNSMEETMTMEETAVTWQIIDEKIYVAVGTNVSKNTSNLIWALNNSQGNKICLVHIHQPSHMIPILGTKFEASTADEHLVKAYRGKETARTDKILEEYLGICRHKGVQAEKLCIKMDSIEKGIVETIYQHRIRKLVMGAAGDKYYSTKMEDLRSRKANFVCEQAPATCQIQFTCKGNLIHTREARMDEVRALSLLLSEFQRFALPQTGTDMLQEVGVESGQNERQSSRSSLDTNNERTPRISSCQSADTSSHSARSEISLSVVQEEPNHSSSPVLPCSGMGLNMINFLINSTKLWQKLTIQNHEHCE